MSLAKSISTRYLEVSAFFPVAGASSSHHHNRSAMTDHIFTFGYESLSLKAFIARLKSARVETVIDVRANPLSRKPGFSKRAPSPRSAKRRN